MQFSWERKQKEKNKQKIKETNAINQTHAIEKQQNPINKEGRKQAHREKIKLLENCDPIAITDNCSAQYPFPQCLSSPATIVH